MQHRLTIPTVIDLGLIVLNAVWGDVSSFNRIYTSPGGRLTYT